jgi:RNA polymerase sigma-70 factor (ECF subfamily)
MVFLRRYWYADEVACIAADYGISEGHVSVLLYRTRKKLKEFLEKEDIYV